LGRRTHFLDRFVHAGGWEDKLALVAPVPRLSTLTLGIVGLGRIGRRVARRMAPFMGRIIANDPYVEQAVADEFGVSLVGLDELLADADLVSLHTPLTAETRHLIGPTQLARMKPGAFLINTSRGPVVDEAALIQALRSKRLAGAALDVMELEPLLPDSPLRELDNVVLTPHFAYYSEQAIEAMRDCVTHSVADVLRGTWPPFVANPSVQPRFPLQAR
jgi:D-3-phosphoglycerate dehydrogenase / 2-oxoglutarate reductase